MFNGFWGNPWPDDCPKEGFLCTWDLNDWVVVLLGVVASGLDIVL